MNLSNIKKGIITTIFGVLFLLVSLAVILFPLFGYESNSMIVVVGATIGTGLLLSPDDLLDKLKDKL